MPSRPRLIVIGGFAGAGKSILARQIGRRLSIPVFEIDFLARSINESPDFHGKGSEHYGVAFDLFFSLSRRFLEGGCDVILDQNMGRAITWKNIEELRTTVGDVDVKIFLLDCPFEICLERVEFRRDHPNYSEITIEELRDHKYKWDFLNENKLPNAIRIDATKPQGVVLKEVLGHLGFREPPQ